MIQTCETHAIALMKPPPNENLRDVFGDVNERCRSHSNWDVTNIDLVTQTRWW